MEIFSYLPYLIYRIIDYFQGANFIFLNNIFKKRKSFEGIEIMFNNVTKIFV